MYGRNWTRIIENFKDLDPIFAQFIQEIPYGSIYPRNELDLKSREIIAISALTQQNLKPQLKSHIIAALKNGMTEVELRELFLHLALFIGFPLVLDGIRIAKEVIDEFKLKQNNE